MNGDCMEFMKNTPDKYYDLALVDPPYGIGAGKGTEVYIKNDKWNTEKKQNDNTIYGNWDDAIPDKKYFDELKRISNKYIIWGGNYFLKYMDVETGVIVWDKKNGDSFFADGEMALHNFNNKLRIFSYLSCGFMGSHKNRDERIHPTQKPVALYKWILKNYAKPGDKILDTHGGSGSICIACHDMGFDLDWIELDEDYYKAAVDRFNMHTAQGSLFEFEGGLIT